MKLDALTGSSAESWFQRLAEAIDLPEARYEAAERSYKSVCKWLEREGSAFENVDITVYTQGSFRLGTAIRPLGEDEQYDLDIVCEFQVSKSSQTQQDLSNRLGLELAAYADRYGMDKPDGWDRCWTLNYADSARFHMDVLPCVPDAARQRLLREAAKVSERYVEQSVAITDRTHQNFRAITNEWPTSNPNGFAAWFHDQMREAFDRRREAIRLVEAKADVAEIPEFRVRTPLQLAVQILKRHRDVYFSSLGPHLKPSSIVITTLSAHAYQQESTVLTALLGIVARMAGYVSAVNGQYLVPNPSDPRENFADSWDDSKTRSFFDWVAAAKEDFTAARLGTNTEAFINTLAPRLGRTLVESAFKDHPATKGTGWKLWKITKAKHRKEPDWPVSNIGQVRLLGTERQKGYRTHPLESDGPDLPIGCELTFTASTNVPEPFEVYWQVVNTGIAATDANGLRGGFEPPRVKDGRLVRTESTAYPGTHSIECFIVKNGFVAARSGLFIVNVGTSKF